MMTRKLEVSFAIAALLSVVACGDEPVASIADAGFVVPPDSGPDAGIPVDDAGQMGMDAAPIADASVPEDASPPARTLVDRGLFGDLPVNNHVLSPNFDLGSRGWFGFSAQGQYAALMRRGQARTPTGQPVLWVPKAPTNPSDLMVLGVARSSSSMLTASVWIGRRAAAAGQGVSVSVLGTDRFGDEVAIDLLAEERSEQDLDGIVWTRYAAAPFEGPVGWVELFFEDSSDEPYFLTGPLVSEIHTSLATGELPRLGRSLRPNERFARSVHAQRMREELGSPAPIPSRLEPR